MKPCGNWDLGQHWLRLWLVAWRHQAITWTNVELLWVRSIGIHLSSIKQEILQPSITEISWKITFLKFLLNQHTLGLMTFFINELGRIKFRCFLPYAVQCPNMVNFLPHPYKRHLIAMGWLLWVLTCFASILSHCCAVGNVRQYWTVLQWHLTWFWYTQVLIKRVFK